jgi:hypothetical protein
MRIDQARGGAFTTHNTGTTAYSVDQWNATGTSSAGVFTLQRFSDTPPTGFTHYLRAKATTADASPASGSIYVIQQFLEGNNVRDLLIPPSSNVPMILSFFARSSLTGTFSGTFRIIGNITNDAYYPFTYVIATPNVWRRYAIPISLNTVTSVGIVTNQNPSIDIRFDLGSGSGSLNTALVWTSASTRGVTGSTRLISTLNATLDFTGVQLEAGTSVTPYEYKPFALEVVLCQRYYEKSYALDTEPGTPATGNEVRSSATQIGATTEVTGTILFKVTKRATPSIFIFAPGGTPGSVEWTSTAGVSTNRVTSLASGTGTTGFALFQTVALEPHISGAHWVADARF